ncbi:F0F1 ATP synthase subunit A [Sphingomonas jatrophae]|nr:F0F1 ATP synthase subunit A [Sphingomonas jatrophae]
MHQFTVEPLFGTTNWSLGGYNIAFTNSALWMVLALLALWVFMIGGMRKQLVPGRWQAAVEGLTGFVDNMLASNVGKEGRRFVPLVFTLFSFILMANLLGLLPIGIFRPLAPGLHPFASTSHFTLTGVLALLSFGTVLVVGFARHGFHFFSLFVPHGTPWWLMWLIPPVEFFSFMVRPFSLALRLFVAMTAGHILLEVLAGFVVQSGSSGLLWGTIVGLPTFLLMIGISALELLVCVIQAYVFALLTSLYLNDAVNLH